MTEEVIKENLSRRYVEVIACRDGFKCQKPDPDTGVDLSITRSVPEIRNGKRRFLDTGEYLEIQLKSTTESSVTFDLDENILKYDLESKTYNDLISRVNRNCLTPLYLVLLVLPDDETKWVEVTNEALQVRRRAYWFLPNNRNEETTNSSTIRINIPLNQVVDLSFLNRCFREAYGEQGND